MARQKQKSKSSHGICGIHKCQCSEFGEYRAFRGLLFWAFVMLFSIRPVSAASLQSASAQVLLPPGVDIRIEAQPRKATVGDPIQIDVDITMPAGYQAVMPNLSGQIGDFHIIEYFPGPAVPDSGKPPAPVRPAPEKAGALQHHRARIIASVYRTGAFTFPPIQATLKTSEGKEYKLSSPAVSIEIQSVLTEKNQSLRDLKRQAEIQEPIRWFLWISLALAGAVLAVIAWRLWRKYRRRSSPIPLQPEADPLDLAEAELRKLLAGGLPDSGHAKRFYIVLSDIVKKILESGCGIQTMERTTLEILENLRHSSCREPDDQERIESLLLRCDLVKFAKFIPSEAEHDSAAKDAFRILADVRKARTVPHAPWGAPVGA